VYFTKFGDFSIFFFFFAIFKYSFGSSVFCIMTVYFSGTSNSYCLIGLSGAAGFLIGLCWYFLMEQKGISDVGSWMSLSDGEGKS
jgi:hypothetical protein